LQAIVLALVAETRRHGGDPHGIDYFDSFPHWASSRERSSKLVASYTRDEAIPSSRDPLSACEPCCLGCVLRAFSSARYEARGSEGITTVATCFRNEREYNGLQGYGASRLREIICIGPQRQ